jgi:hypothetical protein
MMMMLGEERPYGMLRSSLLRAAGTKVGRVRRCGEVEGWRSGERRAGSRPIYMDGESLAGDFEISGAMVWTFPPPPTVWWWSKLLLQLLAPYTHAHNTLVAAGGELSIPQSINYRRSMQHLARSGLSCEGRNGMTDALGDASVYPGHAAARKLQHSSAACLTCVSTTL